MAGAALTVALSFAAAALAARAAPHAASGAGLVLPLGGFLARWRAAARLVGLALFVLVIAAGLLGDPHPMKNLAPTFVWIIWWVGLSLVAACADAEAVRDAAGHVFAFARQQGGCRGQADDGSEKAC